MAYINTRPFDDHEDDHRHVSLPFKDTKDALTLVAAGDPITGDGTAANPLGLALSVNAPITGDGTAANPLDVPTLCEEAAALAIVAHGSDHRAIAFSDTSGSCVLIQVDATGTVTTAPLVIAGVTYNAQTPVQTILAALVAAPELWESVSVAGAIGGGTQTRLVANPTKVIIDDVLGSVGINVAPTQYDLSVAGETTLYPSATAAPNLRERSALGSIVSYGELIDASTTVTTLPYLAIDLGAFQAIANVWTIDYRVRRGATDAKQVGGQIYVLVTSAGVMTKLEASSYGADLIDEVVGGIDTANNHVMLFVSAKSTLFWELSAYANTLNFETAGIPVRWTATAIATLPAYATVIGDIRNTFWQNLTKGRLEFSRITNGVAQNERRVWDINGIVSVASPWAEINTHFIPSVDGAATLGVEIRQRIAGTGAGTASGQLSFSVSAAGAIFNVAWESHGGRLPTNIGVGLNAAGEVVILYRDTGPLGGYGIHTEVYGHTITQKKLWDLTTLAADPSAGYTSFVNATISNGFGAITGTTANFTGAVTASAFIVASDPIIKDNIADLHPDVATKILSNLSVGTWAYNNVMGKGEPSAGITDATKLRDLLPAEMQDAFTPIKQHALGDDPDVLTDVTYVNQQIITAVLWRQLQTDMEAIATANKKLGEAADALATTQKQVAVNQSNIATLTKQMASANATIATLQKEVAALTARVTKLDGGAAKA